MKAVIPAILCAVLAFLGMQRYMETRGGDTARAKKSAPRKKDGAKKQTEAEAAETKVAAADNTGAQSKATEGAPTPEADAEPAQPGVPRVVPYDPPASKAKSIEPKVTIAPTQPQVSQAATTRSASGRKNMSYVPLGDNAQGIPSRVKVYNTEIGHVDIVLATRNVDPLRPFRQSGLTSGPPYHKWEVSVTSGNIAVLWDGQPVRRKEMYYVPVGMNPDGTPSRIRIHNTQVGDFEISLTGSTERSLRQSGRTSGPQPHTWEVSVQSGSLLVLWDGQPVRASDR